MNTDEIRRALRRVTNFDGVYSIDRLPDRPHLLVCNTDPSHRPGRHWICICVENGTGEYFDSFGRPPNDGLRHYMNIVCEHWTFNARQLQSTVSSFCGHYCIYYCLLRSRGITMREIVASFSNDTGFNDCMMHAFVCRSLSR